MGTKEMGGLLALCFFLGCVAPLCAYAQCGYTPPTARDVSYCIRDHATPEVKKRQVTEAIRISPWYHNTVEGLGAEKKRTIQEDVVPELLSFLSDTLSIRRLQSNLILSRSCQEARFIDPNSEATKCQGPCAQTTTCGPIPVPEDHLSACQECNSQGLSCDETHSGGTGVADADYVLYVAADGSTPCASQSESAQVIAFAAHCQMEPELDRPVAGYINLCPNALTSRSLRATVKHELLHALGFSSALFPFFRNSTGAPRSDRDRFGRPPIVEVNGNTVFQASETTVSTHTVMRETFSGLQMHNVQYLVTPAVQREARAHFGCPTLPGLEIENQGGTGTAGSHWEKRITENEAMTGQITQNPAFSRLTLAVLEDSGWYSVNYDNAEPFRFGKDLGCNFTEQSCFSWMQSRRTASQSLEPFCDEQQSPTRVRTSCTPDYLSVGRCNLRQYTSSLPSPLPSPLPSVYQYFSDGSLGGSVELADYCPFYLEVKFESGRITTCSNSSSQPLPNSNLFAETYGTTSRCVKHGSERMWSVNGQTFPDRGGSGCYEFSCSPSGGLTVSVLGVNMSCECEGKEVLFTVSSSGKTFRGSILCPACRDICWDTPQSCPATEADACPGMTEEVQGTSSTLPTPPSNSTLPTPPSNSTLPTPPSNSTLPTPPSNSTLPTPPSNSTLPTPPGSTGTTSTSSAPGTHTGSIAVVLLLGLVATGLGCLTY